MFESSIARLRSVNEQIKAAEDAAYRLDYVDVETSGSEFDRLMQVKADALLSLHGITLPENAQVVLQYIIEETREALKNRMFSKINIFLHKMGGARITDGANDLDELIEELENT